MPVYQDELFTIPIPFVPCSQTEESINHRSPRQPDRAEINSQEAEVGGRKRKAGREMKEKLLDYEFEKNMDLNGLNLIDCEQGERY